VFFFVGVFFSCCFLKVTVFECVDVLLHIVLFKVTDKKLENVDWIIGNIQQYGFYRVNYDDDNWNALLRQLRTDHTVIHPINRAQIINDAWNLAR
jgi:aminopeptidase N